MPNFPNSIDDDTSLFLAVNNSRTRLTSGITDSDLTIPVVTTSGFPNTGFVTILSNPSDITEAEAIRYVGVTSVTFSGTERGAGGTVAFAHNSQDNVDLTVMAEHHNEIKDAVIALEQFVGTTSDPSFVPKDDEGNVVITGTLAVTGTLTVEDLLDVGWATASGSLEVTGGATFKDDVTVSGLATFGDIPVSTLPRALGSFNDVTATYTNTGFETILTTPNLSSGLNLILYRGNTGLDPASVGVTNTHIRALHGGGVMGLGGGDTTAKLGHASAAEVAGFKVVDSNGLTAVRFQTKIGTAGGNIGQYGALGVVAVPLEEMSLTSGTEYWYDNGTDTFVHDTTHTTFFEQASMSFTAPETGDYLILCQSEARAQVKVSIRYLMDGVQMMTEGDTSNVSFESPFPASIIQTLTAGPHIISMEQKTPSSFSDSHRTRFFVLNTSAFDNIQGVTSSVNQNNGSTTFVKHNEFSQTYTPSQSEQLLVLGTMAYAAGNDAGNIAYKLRNETDGEDYRVDSGQPIYQTGAASDTVSRPTLMMHLLDDVLAAKDFDVYFRSIGVSTVGSTEGSLTLWGMSVPLGDTDIAFTNINDDTVTTHEVITDIVTANQSVTVSGLPVMTSLPSSVVFENLTATGTSTLPTLNSEVFTSISGSFSQSLTVSGLPVSTGGGGGGAALTVREVDSAPTVSNVDTIVVTNSTLTDDGGGQVTIDTGGGGGGNIDDINGISSGSVTVTGVGNINTATAGNTITISGVDVVDFRSKNFSGVVVSRESDSDQAIVGNTLSQWTDEIIDTDGFYDSGTNTRLTIPSGKGIKKVILTISPNIQFDNTPATSTYTTVFVRKNGGAMTPDLSWRYPNAFASSINVNVPLTSPSIAVADGDYFEIFVGNNSGGSPVLDNIRSYLSLEVVERDTPFTLGEFISVSGTFTDTLIASGATVNFPNLPTSSGALNAGDLWIDLSADHTLKITPD